MSKRLVWVVPDPKNLRPQQVTMKALYEKAGYEVLLQRFPDGLAGRTASGVWVDDAPADGT